MKITIDRIEEYQVVLELPDMTTAVVPVSLFPDAKEGDVYNISKDEKETNESRNNMQDRFNKLKKTNPK